MESVKLEYKITIATAEALQGFASSGYGRKTNGGSIEAKLLLVVLLFLNIFGIKSKDIICPMEAKILYG